MDTSGSGYKIADADDSGKFPARGIAVASGGVGSNITLLVQGTVRNDSFGYTVGSTIYLSDTAGEGTTTAQSTSGDCVQAIGWGISSTEFYYNFSGHWLEVE